MIKGLALTPPVVGRISIGKLITQGDKRLPDKDDEFTVTTQVQTRDGWIPHPVDQQLRKSPGAKLRSIPVRLLFDDPDLNLRARYTLFDRGTGRPLCVGDGQTCRRATAGGIKDAACPAPANCPLGAQGNCKPYGRLHVLIGQDDEVGTFVFRTTGFNSIRTLATRLRYLHALSGGLLSALPLELRLRGKSTTMSHRTPIYYVDLTIAAGTATDHAVAAAKQFWEARAVSGFDQKALDEAARAGLALGEFEDLEDEGTSVVEEFYPVDLDAPASDDSIRQDAAGVSQGSECPGKSRPTLSHKLRRRAAQLLPPSGDSRREPVQATG
ncbi:phage capsid protein [Xenophilus sp. Marseille-Q4582]|uniref:recombination directionality factor n=1 Tax=Xenophilus sp. Marseille-Q4582 TaxID=2866600 RepID=UPI001CE40C2F|nr:phage capsid protein [Xenophilus sp. Marseille-Q4582]